MSVVITVKIWILIIWMLIIISIITIATTSRWISGYGEEQIIIKIYLFSKTKIKIKINDI
jgi:hypothetical protein